MFLNRGERDKDNETGLKEGGGIEMSTIVLPLRDARSLSLDLLTLVYDVEHFWTVYFENYFFYSLLLTAFFFFD